MSTWTWKVICIPVLIIWCVFTYAEGANSATAYTQTFPNQQKFYVRGDFGAAFYAGGGTIIISPLGGGANLVNFFTYRPENSLMFTSTLGLGWNINRYVRVDITWISFQERFRGDINNFAQLAYFTTRGRANVYMINGYLNLAPLFHFVSRLHLYIGAGVGYSQNKLANIDINLINVPLGFFVTIDGGKRRDVAWRGVLGSAFNLTRNLLLNVEYSYLQAGEFETGRFQSAGPPFTTLAKFKIHTSQIILGLIYFF